MTRTQRSTTTPRNVTTPSVGASTSWLTAAPRSTPRWPDPQRTSGGSNRARTGGRGRSGHVQRPRGAVADGQPRPRAAPEPVTALQTAAVLQTSAALEALKALEPPE